MEKSANRSPTQKYADDVLHGLFISPLEDSESFDRMESEEARILAPLQSLNESKPQTSNRPDNEAGEQLQNAEEEATQKRSAAPTEVPPEQMMLRFAGELKSIKQDLLSIKQHFEALKKPQSYMPNSAAASSATAQPTPREDSSELLEDLRKLLLYLDRLLESLPEEKIEEFANSEYFNLYRHVFEKLGLS